MSPENNKKEYDKLTKILLYFYAVVNGNCYLASMFNHNPNSKVFFMINIYAINEIVGEQILKHMDLDELREVLSDPDMEIKELWSKKLIEINKQFTSSQEEDDNEDEDNGYGYII
jgi:hypothetical protein